MNQFLSILGWTSALAVFWLRAMGAMELDWGILVFSMILGTIAGHSAQREKEWGFLERTQEKIEYPGAKGEGRPPSA